jgi:RNA polymerase sigma-70 factor (ECF subfamily)
MRLDGELDRIYREHRGALFTCALAIARCPERAEDAVQEAFCRLFRLDARPRRLKAYVFRAVRNAAIDQARRAPPPAAEGGDFVFDPAPGPAEAAEAAEFRRRAAECLLGLDEDEREAIVLHLFAGLTFREVADVREAPLGTVTSWYRRGIEKLRQRLE